MIDEQTVIQTIDDFLEELGVSGLVDARKARDQLLELRYMMMKGLQVPDTIESITPNEDIL